MNKRESKRLVEIAQQLEMFARGEEQEEKTATEIWARTEGDAEFRTDSIIGSLVAIQDNGIILYVDALEELFNHTLRYVCHDWKGCQHYIHRGMVHKASQEEISKFFTFQRLGVLCRAYQSVAHPIHDLIFIAIRDISHPIFSVLSSYRIGGKNCHSIIYSRLVGENPIMPRKWCEIAQGGRYLPPSLKGR